MSLTTYRESCTVQNVSSQDIGMLVCKIIDPKIESYGEREAETYNTSSFP